MSGGGRETKPHSLEGEEGMKGPRWRPAVWGTLCKSECRKPATALATSLLCATELGGAGHLSCGHRPKYG